MSSGGGVAQAKYFNYRDSHFRARSQFSLNSRPDFYMQCSKKAWAISKSENSLHAVSRGRTPQSYFSMPRFPILVAGYATFARTRCHLLLNTAMSHLSYPDHLPLPRRPTITKAHCLQYLRYFIDKEKPGLLVFYDDNALETRAAKAEMMVNKLVEMGYSMELALDLTLLTLYDLVLLIGLPPSFFFCFLYFANRCR